jgi:hypothetical protein
MTGVAALALGIVLLAWHGGSTFERVCGAVLAALGLCLMATLYRRPKNGIPVSSAGTSLLWDSIHLVVAGLAMFAVADACFIRYGGAEPVLDEKLRFIGVFMAVVGIPVLSLVTSLFGAQTILVDGKGVAAEGLFGREHVSWEELKGIEVGTQHLPTVKAGLPMERELQKTLTLKGAAGEVTVLEPPRIETKAEILGVMKKHAPERWQPDLDRAIEEWM